MRVTINLNDKARVKLTDAGKQFASIHAPNYMQPDAQGYIEAEVWELAAVFAPEFYNPTPPFEGMEVEVVFRTSQL